MTFNQLGGMSSVMISMYQDVWYSCVLQNCRTIHALLHLRPQEYQGNAKGSGSSSQRPWQAIACGFGVKMSVCRSAFKTRKSTDFTHTSFQQVAPRIVLAAISANAGTATGMLSTKARPAERSEQSSNPLIVLLQEVVTF